MRIKEPVNKSARHYSVEMCQGCDCIYYESCNPFGSRAYCSAYKEWVDEVSECDRYMDANSPYPNAYYKGDKR